MVEPGDVAFRGSIPDIYDEYLVPLIFEDFAEDLAQRASSLGPEDVLEVAAGSGVVTRALQPVLSSTSRLVATDLNPEMLTRARSQLEGADRVVWEVADAMNLPYDDESFDVVVCQFGAMFFPDRVGAYAEARRVLRAGGSFIFNMWDRIESNEFADEVSGAVAELFPEDPPTFLARTPHGFHDPTVYEAELREAGFIEVMVEPRSAVSYAEIAELPAIAYCQGTPLRTEIEARQPPNLADVTQHATQAVVSRWGPGPIESRIAGFVISAVRG